MQLEYLGYCLSVPQTISNAFLLWVLFSTKGNPSFCPGTQQLSWARAQLVPCMT